MKKNYIIVTAIVGLGGILLVSAGVYFLRKDDGKHTGYTRSGEKPDGEPGFTPTEGTEGKDPSKIITPENTNVDKNTLMENDKNSSCSVSSILKDGESRGNGDEKEDDSDPISKLIKSLEGKTDIISRIVNAFRLELINSGEIDGNSGIPSPYKYVTSVSFIKMLLEMFAQPYKFQNKRSDLEIKEATSEEVEIHKNERILITIKATSWMFGLAKRLESALKLKTSYDFLEYLGMSIEKLFEKIQNQELHDEIGDLFDEVKKLKEFWRHTSDESTVKLFLDEYFESKSRILENNIKIKELNRKGDELEDKITVEVVSKAIGKDKATVSQMLGRGGYRKFDMLMQENNAAFEAMIGSRIRSEE